MATQPTIRSARKRNAGAGSTMTFHGAFVKKGAAAEKEAEVTGRGTPAFIKFLPTKQGFRYVVMSKNPGHPVMGADALRYAIEGVRAPVLKRKHPKIYAKLTPPQLHDYRVIAARVLTLRPLSQRQRTVTHYRRTGQLAGGPVNNPHPTPERLQMCVCGHKAHQHKKFFDSRRNCRACACPAFQLAQQSNPQTSAKLHQVQVRQASGRWANAGRAHPTPAKAQAAMSKMLGQQLRRPVGHATGYDRTLRILAIERKANGLWSTIKKAVGAGTKKTKRALRRRGMLPVQLRAPQQLKRGSKYVQPEPVFGLGRSLAVDEPKRRKRPGMGPKATPAQVDSEVMSALRNLGYRANDARALAQQAHGSSFDEKLRSVLRKPNPSGDDVARSAAADAANRQMRKAGRSKWNRSDYNVAAREYARLTPKRNPGLVDGIRAGARVTIVDRFGRQHTGRAVMPSSSGGWVLNMGGAHGTPGLADDRNVVRVTQPKRAQATSAHQQILSSFWGAKRAGNPRLVGYVIQFEDGELGRTFTRKASADLYLRQSKLRGQVLPVADSAAFSKLLAERDAKRSARTNPSEYKAHIYPSGGEFYAYIVRIGHDGEEHVLRGFGGRHFKTRATAERSTEKYLAKLRQENPKRKRNAKRKRNSPEGQQRARKLFKEFHGAPSRRVSTKPAPDDVPDDVAKLGDLVMLEARTPAGDLDRYEFSGSEAPMVVSNTKGTQIYFVGGDQHQVETVLSRFAEQRNKEQFDLGECRRIVYFTRKRFDGFQPVEYDHHFGEDSKNYPRLTYNVNTRRLALVGGAYKIRPEGIVD